jgi:hypothetical protein
MDRLKQMDGVVASRQRIDDQYFLQAQLICLAMGAVIAAIATWILKWP